MPKLRTRCGRALLAIAIATGAVWRRDGVTPMPEAKNGLQAAVSIQGGNSTLTLPSTALRSM
jgi:hypothetical protein